MAFNQAMKHFRKKLTLNPILVFSKAKFKLLFYNISIHLIILLLAMKIAKEADMALKCQQSNQTVSSKYLGISKKDLVCSLLQNEVKEHEFFSSINWDDLEQKRLPPPFNPSVVRFNNIIILLKFLTFIHKYIKTVNLSNVFLQESQYDISNFDPEFTEETVPNSVCFSSGQSIINASVMEADDAFLGFSYAPPSEDSFL